MTNNNKPFTCFGSWVGHLMGHVKAARFTHYQVEYINGFPIKVVDKHYIETFDKKGKHLKTSEYDKNGILRKDEQFIYSEDGLLSELIGKEGDKVTSHDIHEYDSKKQRIRITLYGENEELRGYIVNVYDNNGLLIEERRESPTLSCRWKWTHAYDINGKCVSSKH